MAWDHLIATITCVYATDEIEEIVCRSLQATAAEFPDDRRMVAFDRETPLVRDVAMGLGFQELDLPAGRPPRLKAGLRAAVDAAESALLWSIEHDILVPQGARTVAETWKWTNRHIAGVDLPTGDESGLPCYPHRGRKAGRVGSISLGCSLWEIEVLAAVDWAAIDEFPAVDQSLSRWCRATGHGLELLSGPAATHLVAGARRFLDA